MEKLDDWHYNFSKIDGYNATINFSLACRGTGRTTSFWQKAWKRFASDGQKTIVQFRQENYINEKNLDSIRNVIGKFTAIPVFHYKKTALGKSATIDVSCGGKTFLTIVAMSSSISCLKGIFTDNVAFWFADEFICNERLGERYCKDEAFKFKEAWTTFYRESHGMKAYFAGNPYSLYNPYFSTFGIDPKLLKLGTIVSGGGDDASHPLWAVERFQPKGKLLEELKKNPMYSRELDEYEKYALYGEAINDENIFIMEKAPKGFFLRFFFKIDGKNLGVWENPDFTQTPLFWVGISEEIGKRRDVYCFDFKDLSERTVLFSHEERQKFDHFRMAIRNRNVAFSTLECDYLIEEIYPTL